MSEPITYLVTVKPKDTVATYIIVAEDEATAIDVGKQWFRDEHLAFHASAKPADYAVVTTHGNGRTVERGENLRWWSRLIGGPR